MNDLSKAYIKATAYFYVVMAGAFAAAWALYAAKVDLDPLFGDLVWDRPGVLTDLVALIVGVVPGACLLRGWRKKNGEVIARVNEAPLSGQSVQALVLSLLTGAVGFGLYMALVFAFLPHLPTTFDPYFITREPGAIMALDERVEMFKISLPLFLGAGVAFGAFMWGATQANKVVKFGTWAAFVAFVYFNPLMLMVEQAPPPAPTLMESSADSVTDSPTVEEEMKRMDERE